ncbi:DNA/RNA nuclease SfsA [Candidatus Bathyarchaeota archaeon]|nr:DNA/RNA nuclease SfsA [Candidatus Bathyarchaeota archaeon]
MIVRGKALTVNLDFNLVTGRFLQRINRFKVLVEIDGEESYAHLPNSGRLATVLHYGIEAYLKKVEDKFSGKNPYRLFAVQRVGVPIIVDAQFSNIIAKMAIEHGLIDSLADYKVSGENFRVDEHVGARLDLMLERGMEKFYIEVKSVTHAVNGVALFPDAPTLRGRKHIQELTALVRRGFKSGIIFSIQRPDAIMMKPNVEVDRHFTELLREAVVEGVKIFTLNSTLQPPRSIKIEPNRPTFTF